MMGAARRGILAAVMAIGFALPAAAADNAVVTDGDRVYRNYMREAATVQPGQLRLEIRGMTFEDAGNVRLNLLGFPARESVSRESGGIFDVLGSYGLGNAGEIGFLVPTYIQSQRVDGVTVNNQDVGDVQLYGKFKHSVAEHCVVAGGLELTTPTGVERKSFGTGEYAVNPFVSSRYQKGRFALGGHVGYQIYAGDVNDVANYSIEAIVRGSESYAIRAELSGRWFEMEGTRFHDVVVMPGIDYNLTSNFVLRPTGLANITDEALDWGLGVGVAYTF
ncbi:MAG: hypothetical protein HY699_17325 [Deltaproteobacteria bacterium]|nr:hypothetical protein [Deltaproteobacteria bacterium]